MSAILPQAQALVLGLKALMPSIYQQDSLQALLGLFLEGQGTPLPEHCKLKSASALSGAGDAPPPVDFLMSTNGRRGRSLEQYVKRVSRWRTRELDVFSATDSHSGLGFLPRHTGAGYSC